MTTGQVLEQAAGLIEQGWTTGWLWREGLNGRMAYCALGAIFEASGCFSGWPTVLRDAEVGVASPTIEAMQAVAAELDAVPLTGSGRAAVLATGDAIARWNNTVASGATEVATTLRNAKRHLPSA